MGPELMSIAADAAAHVDRLELEEHEEVGAEGRLRILAHDHPELVEHAQALRVWYFDDGSAHLGPCTAGASRPDTEVIRARASLIEMLGTEEFGGGACCLTHPLDQQITLWALGSTELGYAEHLMRLEQHTAELASYSTISRTLLLTEVLRSVVSLGDLHHPVFAGVVGAARALVRDLLGELSQRELGMLLRSAAPSFDLVALTDARRELDEVFQEILLGVREDDEALSPEDAEANTLVLVEWKRGAYPEVVVALACSGLGWVGDPEGSHLRGVLRCSESFRSRELTRVSATGSGSWTPVAWDPPHAVLDPEHEPRWRELAHIALVLTHSEEAEDPSVLACALQSAVEVSHVE